MGVFYDLVNAFGGAAHRLFLGKNCESLELWRERIDDAEETDEENHELVHAMGRSNVCAHVSVVGLALGSLGLVMRF